MLCWIGIYLKVRHRFSEIVPKLAWRMRFGDTGTLLFGLGSILSWFDVVEYYFNCYCFACEGLMLTCLVCFTTCLRGLQHHKITSTSSSIYLFVYCGIGREGDSCGIFALWTGGNWSALAILSFHLAVDWSCRNLLSFSWIFFSKSTIRSDASCSKCSPAPFNPCSPFYKTLSWALLENEISTYVVRHRVHGLL